MINMNDFQKQIKEVIDEVWKERLRLIKMRGEIYEAMAFGYGGYVDGLCDGINAMADRAGVERIANVAEVVGTRLATGASTMTKKQQEMSVKHGTPEQFERAIWKACDDLAITTQEAVAAINGYNYEWSIANGQKHEDYEEDYEDTIADQP